MAIYAVLIISFECIDCKLREHESWYREKESQLLLDTQVAHVFACEIINVCLFFMIVTHLLFTQINHHMEKFSIQFSSAKWKNTRECL